MSRVPGGIADRSRQVAAVAAAYPALAARADRLAERVDAQRFHVAVVGAFKRGKSTVINALLDRTVLPTGVLPLTAIATEVSYGTPGATIVGLDGTRSTISLSPDPPVSVVGCAWTIRGKGALTWEYGSCETRREARSRRHLFGANITHSGQHRGDVR